MSDEISEVEGDAMAFTEDLRARDTTQGGLWAYMPGDRVLCLVPLSQGPGEVKDELVAGTVMRIMIPGPMRAHKVVQVELDEDSPIKLGWWDPDRIEHFKG